MFPILVVILITIAFCAWKFSKSPNNILVAGAVVISGLTGIAIIYMANNSAYQDTELINGVVTEKTRSHGTYDESYSCNCRTVTRTRRVNGKTERYTEEKCDTCHRTWYTVKWNCATTVGDISVASTKSTSRTVYLTPNPTVYELIVVGDPATRTHAYTNYVIGSEDTILKTKPQESDAKFGIPDYPLNVYNVYKVDRFFTDLAIDSTTKQAWIDMVANLNRDVGAKRQANIIVYITKHSTDFAFALERRWEGFNKNDIIVVIGADDLTSRPKWVNVMSWTKREDFKVHLRESLATLPALDIAATSAKIQASVLAEFERRKMRDFEYLAEENNPSGLQVIVWMLIVSAIGFVVNLVSNDRKF